MEITRGAIMPWNVFRFCTRLRGLGSMMIILVLYLVGPTYYAMVVANYGPAIFHGGLDFLTAFPVLLLFHALFYTFLETSVVTSSLLPYFLAFFTADEISRPYETLSVSFVAFVLNLALLLSIMGFAIMHILFVAANTTTIEAYETKTTPDWPYDLGWKKNFEQVFGTDKRYWFIPAYSEEDLRQMPALQGLEYPTQPNVEALQQL